MIIITNLADRGGLDASLFLFVRLCHANRWERISGVVHCARTNDRIKESVDLWIQNVEEKKKNSCKDIYYYRHPVFFFCIKRIWNSAVFLEKSARTSFRHVPAEKKHLWKKSLKNNGTDYYVSPTDSFLSALLRIATVPIMFTDSFFFSSYYSKRTLKNPRTDLHQIFRNCVFWCRLDIHRLRTILTPSCGEKNC